MNKEACKQLAIKAWKEDEWDFQDCNGLKLDGFECEKLDSGILCTLKFKDSKKQFRLTIDPSVSNYKELTK